MPFFSDAARLFIERVPSPAARHPSLASYAHRAARRPRPPLREIVYVDFRGHGRSAPVAARMRVRTAAVNRGHFEVLPRFDMSGRLGAIRVPTLCLSGTEDWIIPPAEGPQRLENGLPSATVRALDNCGRFTFLDRPQAVADALRS
jgi:pimeloyl-ACP methyl ester carboxylesterase